ncbi:MAG: putative metal-binding motif-containing protein, partial [Pseudomonadota bacterium]
MSALALPSLALAALLVGPARAAHTLSGPFDDTVAIYTTVTNGGMETHSGSVLGTWLDYYSGKLGYDSRASYAGAGSAGLLDQTWAHTGAGVALQQSVSVTQRSDYVLSGYIYNAILGGGSAYLDLADQSYAQADGGSGDCSTWSTSGAGAWQFVYCQFTVPAGTHSVTVRTVVDGTVNAGSYVFFDQVALTPAASFSPPDSLSADDDGDGYSELGGDCDDDDSGVSPGAVEHCGGIDEDCDGSVDAGAVDATTWYADGDGDGYGGASTTAACTQPSGYLATSTDCDDADAAIHPGAAEHCDGVDNDCSGVIDDSYAVDAATWYADGDGDGYGGASTATACTQPSGYLATSTDCDDADAAIHPGATEHCDGVDTDGSGVIDDSYAVDA